MASCVVSGDVGLVGFGCTPFKLSLDKIHSGVPYIAVDYSGGPFGGVPTTRRLWLMPTSRQGADCLPQGERGDPGLVSGRDSSSVLGGYFLYIFFQGPPAPANPRVPYLKGNLKPPCLCIRNSYGYRCAYSSVYIYASFCIFLC